MDDKLPIKTTMDRVYDAIAVPAQLFPPTAVIVRLIDTFWPRNYPSRMERCIRELYEHYECLSEECGYKFVEYLQTDEGETLLLMAFEAMLKTHKAEKLANISRTFISVVTAPIVYDKKEYILKVATELEPFDVIVLKRIANEVFGEYEIDNYDKFYSNIVNSEEISKDEFYYIAQKLVTLSLIRISSLIDPFNDVYSANIVTMGGSKDKPHIVITELGRDLLNYFYK